MMLDIALRECNDVAMMNPTQAPSLRGSKYPGATSHGEDAEVVVGAPDAEEVPPIRVGLRIPYALLLIAISEWIDPDVPAGEVDRYQPLCQQLLEDALLASATTADKRAKAWAAGHLPADEPRPPSVRDGQESCRQMAVKLSPQAHSIAQKLGLREPKNDSVPNVCERLLCEELRKRGRTALDTLSRVADVISSALGPSVLGKPPGED